MKLLRLSVVAALLCAPLPAFAQTAYGTSDLSRNAAVVDVPGTGPNGQTTIKAQATVSIDPATGSASSGGTSGRAAIAFRQTCTASAVAMASNALQNGVVIKALSTNGGTAYLGPAGVTTSTGYPLAAGEAISYGVANTSQLYLICSDTSSVIAVTGN